MERKIETVPAIFLQKFIVKRHDPFVLLIEIALSVIKDITLEMISFTKTGKQSFPLK